MPVVRPEAYKDSTAWIATYMAGALNVSNMIWVIYSKKSSILNKKIRVS